MEKIKSNTKTIAVLGSRKGVGKSFISQSLSYEMALRGLSVVYGSTYNADQKINGFKPVPVTGNEKGEIFFRDTEYSGLKVIGYSNTADKMSPKKIEDLLVDLPRKLNQDVDYLVYNLTDPFAFPDRYILLNTDYYVMVVKHDPALFSDIFQTLEKLAFLPNKPKEIYLIFNNQRDLDQAFESYLQITRQAEEFNINIKIFFLGVVPADHLRQTLSGRFSELTVKSFADSSLRGNMAFIAEKIIKSTNPQVPLSGARDKNINQIDMD